MSQITTLKRLLKAAAVSGKPQSIDEQAAENTPWLLSAALKSGLLPELPEDTEPGPLARSAPLPPEQAPVEAPLDIPEPRQDSVSDAPLGKRLFALNLRGTGHGPDRTILPEDLDRQAAFEARQAEEAAAKSAITGAVARQVGSSMNPADELASGPVKAGPTITSTPAPAAAPASTPEADAPVDTPWYEQPWVRNTGIAAAGIGAVGLLAYLLMNQDAKKPRRRRRLATA